MLNVLLTSLKAFFWEDANHTVRLESIVGVAGVGGFAAAIRWGRSIWGWATGHLDRAWAELKGAPSAGTAAGWPVFDAETIRSSSRVLYIDDSAKSKLACRIPLLLHGICPVPATTSRVRSRRLSCILSSATG